MAEMPAAPANYWSIEPRSGGIIARAREIWQYRRMFLFFGDRAIRKLYQRTVLGKAWIFLRPLVPLAVRVFLFGALLQVGSDSDVPYFLFMAVGTSAWELFAACAMWATRSLQLNSGILRRLYVPRIIVPMAGMAPGLVYFAIYVGVLVVAFVYYRINDGVWYFEPAGLILAPVAIALILALALAIGLFTSVMGAEVRDVRFGLGYVLEFWVYLTPVVYPMELVPEGAQWAFNLNPMAVLVVAFRGAVLGGEAPGLVAWGLAVGIIAIVMAAGLRFFYRAEAQAVDSM